MEPVDLTDLLGEVWCVTFRRTPAPELLAALGVPATGIGPVAGDEPALRLAGLSDEQAERLPVMLIGRDIGAGWSIAVETDGWTGFVGADERVLGRLPTGGDPAATILRTPAGGGGAFAAGNGVELRLDLSSGRRWGSQPGRWDAEFARAGLSSWLAWDSAGAPVIEALTQGQRAALVVEVVTGVRLAASDLDGPWIGGTTGSS